MLQTEKAEVEWQQIAIARPRDAGKQVLKLRKIWLKLKRKSSVSALIQPSLPPTL
jgi:hypothetical protein